MNVKDVAWYCRFPWWPPGTVETGYRSRPNLSNHAAVIDFTHALGIPILAEGIENSDQAEVLRDLSKTLSLRRDAVTNTAEGGQAVPSG
jgi:hypothetical protein